MVTALGPEQFAFYGSFKALRFVAICRPMDESAFAAFAVTRRGEIQRPERRKKSITRHLRSVTGCADFIADADELLGKCSGCSIC